MAVKNTDKNVKNNKKSIGKKNIKKTLKIKEEKNNSTLNIEKSNNKENNLYRKTIEDLKKRLLESEKKVENLSIKYKKAVEIQENKIKTKYEKIIKRLEKENLEKENTKKEQKINIEPLQKKLKLLEEEKNKLEIEKDKIYKKNLKLEKYSNTKTSEKETIKSLEKKLRESEKEKNYLKIKLKETIENIKKERKVLSKDELKEKKENIKLLKIIQRQTKELEKKRELIKKEQDKLKEIKNTIESSAKNIVSTMNKSKNTGNIKDDDSTQDIMPELESEEEKRIVRLASLLSTAIEKQREIKDRETEKEKLSSDEEERLNKTADKLERMSENGLEGSDNKEEKLKKRAFTIIDKIENSRIEINEGTPEDKNTQNVIYSEDTEEDKDSNEENLKKDKTKLSKNDFKPVINVTVQSDKESAKLQKPETTLKPASEMPTMRMKLLDDVDEYEKRLVITYGFDNMPENTYYSKYKKILRNAARITLLGNLQEGLDMFKLVKEQNLPKEYKDMIEKNIQDITYYLRGLHRVRME